MEGDKSFQGRGEAGQGKGLRVLGWGQQVAVVKMVVREGHRRVIQEDRVWEETRSHS